MRRKATVVGENDCEAAAGSGPRPAGPVSRPAAERPAANRGRSQQLFPLAARPRGEHGVRALTVGVPAVLGPPTACPSFARGSPSDREER